VIETLISQIAATSALEWGAALTGFACVWLTVREHMACWPTGLVSAALYVVVFFKSRLYADMGLQGVFIALQIYGWLAWARGDDDHEPLVVSRTPPRTRLALLAMFAAGTALLAHTLYRYTDASLPWVDSTQTVMSLIAQYLLSFKRIENWMLWIVVDVISIWMYQYKALYLTAVLYAVFLCLAVQGLRRWQRVLAAVEDTP